MDMEHQEVTLRQQLANGIKAAAFVAFSVWGLSHPDVVAAAFNLLAPFVVALVRVILSAVALLGGLVLLIASPPLARHIVVGVLKTLRNVSRLGRLAALR